MPNFEPIELTKYPIWEYQQGENERAYEMFSKYFLPMPKRSLRGAYDAYCADIGSSKVSTSSNQRFWNAWAKSYHWTKRANAYHRKLAFDNLAFIEQKKLDLIESELELSKLLLDRARDLLSQGIGEQDKLKDAPALARAASEISRRALGVDDNLERAILTVTRAGLEVSDPALAEVLNQRGLVGDDSK